MNHIHQTLSDIRTRINDMLDLEHRITTFLGGTTSTSSPSSQASSPINSPPAPAPATKPPRKTKPAKKPSGPRVGTKQLKGSKVERTREQLPIIAKLAEPFTSGDIGNAVNLINGSSLLNRWVANGWIKRTGTNQYARTAHYPAPASFGTAAKITRLPARDTAAAPRVSIPGMDKPSPMPLGQQLEAACRDRDEAVAHGHERLAAILQDKINALEKKLDQL